MQLLNFISGTGSSQALPQLGLLTSPRVSFLQIKKCPRFPNHFHQFDFYNCDKQRFKYNIIVAMMNFYSQSSSFPPSPAPQQQSSEKVPKKEVQVQYLDVERLYRSRDKLREFVHEIGGLRYAGIRSDVISHCDKIKVNLNQNLSFEKIEKMVKNRIEKMIKNKRLKKNWSEQDVVILIWIVSKYADLKRLYYVQQDLLVEDWDFIAEMIPGVTGENCMFKWLSLKKNNLSENSWSERQSYLLIKIVQACGEEDWPLISQKLYYQNSSSSKIYRCPKQCREHWNCYLNPKLKKGPWSKQEDELLLRNVKRNNGQKRWAEMVKLFNGRTENALKNRFTLIIQKETKSHQNGKNMSQLELIEQYLQRTYVEQLVNIKQEGEEVNPENKVKQKEKKRKEQLQTPKNSRVRASLRRRQSTRSCRRYRSESNSSQIEEEPVKIEEEDADQIHYPSLIGHSLMPHSLGDINFSQPYQCYQRKENDNNEHEIQISLQLEQSSQLKKDNKESEQILDEVGQFRIIPFNKQLFNHLETFASASFVPCVLIDNKLTKYDS